MKVRVKWWMSGVMILAAMGIVGGCYSSGNDDDEPPSIVVLDDTGGGGGGGKDTGMPNDTGGQSCNAGLEKCGGSCVNVTNNADHCGACGNSCGDQPCENGQCVTQPDDCTKPGSSCQGFTYCDLGSGECKPGCGDDDQCGPNSSCDIGTRDCTCDAGFHDCNGQCLSDSSPNSCGSRCSPCPSDPNGSATCAVGTCGLSCQNGYKNCGGQCASCPAGGPGSTTTCNGSQCVTACKTGYITCSSGCCPASIEKVDDTRTTDKDIGGVVVDSQGAPHVIYMSEPSNGNGQRVLKHATRQSGSWSAQTIKVGGRTIEAGYTSWRVAIDSQDDLYTYNDDFGPSLIYQDGGTWKEEEIPGSADFVVSIKIDSSDNPHLLVGGSGDSYYYKYWDGSSWTDEEINPSDEFDGARMAIVSSGTPHVVGYERSFDYLYYATNKQGSWSVEKVGKTVVQEPRQTRIVVDQSDTPHIFFVEDGADELYEAVPGSSQWQLTAIQRGGGSRYDNIRNLEGGYTGRPMTFAYAYDGTLYFGRKQGGSWTFEEASALGDVYGGRSTFAVESNGDPHFLWKNSQGSWGKYAH